MGDQEEHDNIMRKYLLPIFLGAVFAAPKPQELADSSEVELIPPFDSGDGDKGTKPVVIVVKPTSFGDVFAGFPGFVRFPGSNSFPFSGAGAGGFPAPPHLGLDDIFGGDDEESLLPSSSNNYDNHNVTYSEKVLPDGSILRINKTVIHDTDENGNGFFFQSSVHHVFMDGEEEDEKIA